MQEPFGRLDWNVQSLTLMLCGAACRCHAISKDGEFINGVRGTQYHHGLPPTGFPPRRSLRPRVVLGQSVGMTRGLCNPKLTVIDLL